MNQPLLRVNIQASYGKRQVLRDVHFELNAGEALGFVGTSGAGKSTLVMALLGLLPWRGGRVSGEVMMDGRNLLELSEREMRMLRGKEIALVPQSPMTALNPAVSLRSHFEEAWKAHEDNGRKALDTRLAELLADVQLPGDGEFLRRRSGEVSVGQAQRVMIALALLHRPKVLVADEPTSALDPVTQAEVLTLLKRLNRSTGTALVYVSHDLISVLQMCDRMAVLSEGSVVECLAVGEIELATHAATLALLGSLPVPAKAIVPDWDVSDWSLASVVVPA